MAESIDTQFDATWYVAVSSDHADGPLRPQDVKQRLQEGIYATSQLAWRQGMTDWLPIDSITEFGGSKAPALPRPFALPLVGIFNSPLAREFDLLRVVGRVALAFSLLTLAISILAWLWGRSWFEHAFFLLLIFALCEGQAGIWKTLLALQPTSRPPVAPEVARP